MSTMRLDKFLALSGVGTRSEVKKKIKNGEIKINGETAEKPEMKVDPERDSITCGNELLSYHSFLALMFHKPAGCITAVSDPSHKTVMDFIDCPQKSQLFPVGRLDIDTEGLLLFLNDGDLAHKMLSPRHHVEKTYYVETEGILTEEDILAFQEGVDIGEKNPTLPAKLTILERGAKSKAELTICEGKFHQVKRMFADRGKKVCYLKRISMGGIKLDESLAPGKWRYLTEEESAMLQILK